MRVFISADMEGATGVCHRDHLLAGGQDYEVARRWLTGDVNAAVEGAVAAGATDVVVADGHATMRNLVLDDLHEAARLVQGPAQARNRPFGQLAGHDAGGYDAAFMIGHHSRAGTPGGLLAHTWVGMLVKEIRLQGEPASESKLNAALLGHYGVPVVLATGADDYCAQVRDELGDDLTVVAVKETIGPSAVLTLTPARAQAAIRAAAAAAMQQPREPLRTGSPVRIEVEFWRDEMRERAAELAGEPVGRTTLRYDGDDAPAVFRPVWAGLAHALRDEASFLR
ncbi:MAG: M55 family metallopeptidase [Planctomycetota bacterium]|nr:M55 family metallopeptidase [Planctomycetota bacterium]